jgi:prevent-host-death family protein
LLTVFKKAKIAYMEKVGSTILKNSLNVFLTKVAAGARIIITDRGRPVAKLVPLDESGVEPSVDELIAELITKGLVSSNSHGGTGIISTPPVGLKIGGRPASDLLIQDRDR